MSDEQIQTGQFVTHRALRMQGRVRPMAQKEIEKFHGSLTRFALSVSPCSLCVEVIAATQSDIIPTIAEVISNSGNRQLSFAVDCTKCNRLLKCIYIFVTYHTKISSHYVTQSLRRSRISRFYFLSTTVDLEVDPEFK